MKDRVTRNERAILATVILILTFVLWECLGATWCRSNGAPSQNHDSHSSENNYCAANGGVMFREAVVGFVHDNREDINAFSTIVIAAFAIVLALVTGRQARLTKLLADEGKEGAEAAKISAEAAKQSADNALNIETARIFIANISLPLILADDGSNKIYGQAIVSIRNLGRTPAIISQASFDLVVCERLPDVPHYERLMDYNYGQRIISPEDAPWSEKAYFVEHILTTDDWQDIMNRRMNVWLYGVIAYWDIFHCENRYGFCSMLVPKMVAEAESKYQGRFIHWQKPNYTYYYRNPNPGDASRVAPIFTASPRYPEPAKRVHRAPLTR